MDAVTHEVRDLGRRLRTLEERYSNLQTKTQITEQNILSRHKRVTVELKTMNMDINELKKEMMEIKDRILLLIKEIQTLAKKEEFQVLQKYINLWEPINFVTRNEVNDIIKETLRKNNIPVK
jgi:predicted  nucleic acid-binding Zn-ribbon protein